MFQTHHSELPLRFISKKFTISQEFINDTKIDNCLKVKNTNKRNFTIHNLYSVF